MNHTIIEENGFKYVEEGEGEVLMLLHGLFGALSNFYDIIEGFKKTHKVVIPILPLYDLPIEETTVGGYVNYVERFVAYKGYQKVIVLGNSLGGHIALIYALANPDKVIRVLATAKSAIRQNLAEEVAKISAPTLLIWGNNDTITPPFVGEEFHKLIPNSQLFFIDKCGHAPMMEQPEEFNRYLGKFLNEIN